MSLSIKVGTQYQYFPCIGLTLQVVAEKLLRCFAIVARAAVSKKFIVKIGIYQNNFQWRSRLPVLHAPYSVLGSVQVYN